MLQYSNSLLNASSKNDGCTCQYDAELYYLGKVWTTPPSLRGEKFCCQIFLGGGVHHGVHKLHIMTHYNL